MGFTGGSVGFISSGGSGGSGGGTTVDVEQYTVGQSGAPTDGSSVFNPSPAINGTKVTVFVNSGGYLFKATPAQFSFMTSGGKITQITLLGGLLFNTGEQYTITGYSS